MHRASSRALSFKAIEACYEPHLPPSNYLSLSSFMLNKRLIFGNGQIFPSAFTMKANFYGPAVKASYLLTNKPCETQCWKVFFIINNIFPNNLLSCLWINKKNFHSNFRLLQTFSCKKMMVSIIFFLNSQKSF